ncbi:MAG: hypothetical protein R3B70_07255 [Polyangiaceae bacterium]
MTDEELLKALANEARALDPAGDPRLPRLVDGSLPEPERAALTEQAATSPSARDALAAFDPLPDASRRRLFETASAALSTASPADTASPPRADTASPPRDTASPPRKDTPARIAPRRSRAFVPVFAGLSMAAALAFFLTREAPQPLPPFALEASGAAGVRSPRSPRPA